MKGNARVAPGRGVAPLASVKERPAQSIAGTLFLIFVYNLRYENFSHKNQSAELRAALNRSEAEVYAVLRQADQICTFTTLFLPPKSFTT